MGQRHGYQKKRDTKYKVPDALFCLTTDAKIYATALELELSLKSMERYRKLIRLLAISKDFSVVLVIVSNPDIEKKYSLALEKFRQTDEAARCSPLNAFYFATLDEVLDKQLDAPFFGKHNSFTLASLQPVAISPPHNNQQNDTRNDTGGVVSRRFEQGAGTF